MKKIKIIIDVLYNIIAAAVPLIVLQLIVFPILAKEIDNDLYGLMLTIYTLLNIVAGTTGATLNNMRLLHQDKYDAQKKYGDFQVLAVIGSLFTIIGMIVGLRIVENEVSFFNIFFTVIISIMILLHDYWLVSFRIKLNYKFILYNRLFMSIGYIFGLFLFQQIGSWHNIFFWGYLFGIIFILFNSSIWKEPFTITKNMKFIVSESVMYMTSVFLLRLTAYADKVLLYPILGGTAVSVYYAATSLTKVVSLAITPINGVMLTYLAKINDKPKKLFLQVLFLGSVVGIVGYFFSVVVSGFMLEIIYPMFAQEALKYIFITSAITVFNIIASIIQPFVLKFSSMKFQIIINLIDVGIYISVSLLLLSLFGLMGFSVGVMISRVVKVFILIIVYYKVDK